MRRRSALLIALAVLLVGAAAAYEPGDVNGDGSVDAADLTCETATIYDPNDGCAVATTSPLDNVVTVSPSGGDYTSIQAALDAITASESDRWLIRVGPGTYTETVTMESWIDIECAGECVTIVQSSGSSAADTGTVVGADNAELRLLSVTSDGGDVDAFAIAIYNDFASPKITHVTAGGSGATDVNCAIYNTSSSPVLRSLTLTATATGDADAHALENRNNSAPITSDIQIDASGGLNAYGVYNHSTTATLVGLTITATGATNYTAGVYTAHCPTLDLEYCHIEVDAGGGAWAIGFVHSFSNGHVRNCVIHAVGGSSGCGAEVYSDVSGHWVWVTNSYLSSDDRYARANTPDASTMRLGGCALIGNSAANVKCAGNWNGAFTFYASTCP